MSEDEYSDARDSLENELEVSILSREELCERLTCASIKFETKDSTERLKRKLTKYLNSLKQITENNTSNDNTNASKMATIESKTRLEFELGKDDWETFIERLELYFTVNGVMDSKKTSGHSINKSKSRYV